MCLSEKHIHWAPPTVRDSDNGKAKTFTDALEAMASRPSWTLRGVFKPTTGRPGLPRRFHTKINLNDYWSALEKVVKVEVSFPTRPASPSRPEQDNEVNDNIANERAELEMEVDQQVEVRDEEAMEVAKVTPTPVEVILPAKVESAVSPARRRERARRSPLSSPVRSEPPCGSESPRRRTPLGTINGMESRTHLRKNLSPLSAFADNLARRLAH